MREMVVDRWPVKEGGLVGTFFRPGDVKAVVGYVPSGVVWQGILFGPRLLNPGSSWTLEGRPLPFVRFATPTPPRWLA